MLQRFSCISFFFKPPWTRHAFTAAKIRLKCALKYLMNSSSPFLNLLLWWSPFPWSDKQQLLLLKKLVGGCFRNDYQSLISQSRWISKIPLSKKLCVMDLISEDCEIQVITRSVAHRDEKILKMQDNFLV